MVPGRITSDCSNVRARGLCVTRTSRVEGSEVSRTQRVSGPRKHVYFLQWEWWWWWCGFGYGAGIGGSGGGVVLYVEGVNN